MLPGDRVPGSGPQPGDENPGRAPAGAANRPRGRPEQSNPVRRINLAIGEGLFPLALQHDAQLLPVGPFDIVVKRGWIEEFVERGNPVRQMIRRRTIA